MTPFALACSGFQSRHYTYGRRVPSKLPRVTAPDFLRALQRDGWHIVRRSGSHAQLKHPTKSGRVTVAMHKQQIIAPKTLHSALTQAGMTVDELRELL